jgi:uncharacterized protein YjbI with pentapeptide repeats
MLKAILFLVLPAFSQTTLYHFDVVKKSCEGYNKEYLTTCWDGRDQFLVDQKYESLNLSGSNLKALKISGLTVKNFVADYVKMNEAMIKNFRFQQASFVETDWRGVTLSKSRFNNFNFENDNFSGAKITSTHFKNGSFRKINFKDAVITDTLFEDSILPSNIKTEATLINVRFKNCKFEE